jgi:hypothetical protein
MTKPTAAEILGQHAVSLFPGRFRHLHHVHDVRAPGQLTKRDFECARDGGSG